MQTGSVPSALDQGSQLVPAGATFHVGGVWIEAGHHTIDRILYQVLVGDRMGVLAASRSPGAPLAVASGMW